MADSVNGVPFWTLEFDRSGTPVDANAVETFLEDVAARRLTDVFIFSHGWNNDRVDALSLYRRFFEGMTTILDDAQRQKKRSAHVGLAGVIWPSILWPDDAASATLATVATRDGGAAAVGAAMPVSAVTASPAAVNAELKKAYDDDRQQVLVDELTALLAEQPRSEAALVEFKRKLASLLASEPADGPPDRKAPDYAEAAIGQLSDTRWRALLDVLGTEAARREGATGGAVGLGDPFKKLWAGARDALRVATYWQMKQRAGIVGRDGLGRRVLSRFVGRDARVHLIGHSFGARLVSFSLSGLPEAATGSASPVKSVFLLQGAFSHYAFADRLPHDASRSGALKGMSQRVDGPLVVTHSRKDTAVGVSYPAASFLNQDDAAAAVDQSVRFGAIGHDGAQAVEAVAAALGDAGTIYEFEPGKFLNLDGNQVIVRGGPPSGAHSDIVYPHTAWAALAAAGIV